MDAPSQVKLRDCAFPDIVVAATGDDAHRSVCAAVAAIFALPLDAEDISVERVSGGLSNCLFRVAGAASGLQRPAVLVRVFGPLALDRRRENEVFADLADAGIGPALLATFGNGRVEEFLEGYRTLEPGEFLGGEHGPAIAERLARLHSVPQPACSGASAIWDQLHQWLEGAVAADFSQRSAQEQAQVQQVLEAVMADLTKWQRVFSKTALRRQEPAEHFWSQVKLCHNDLHVNNILAPGPSAGANDAPLRFIDFEYAAPNHIGMDICNSLNNIPFVFFLKGGADSAYEAKGFPSDEQIKPWLQTYLRASAAASPEGADAVNWANDLLGHTDLNHPLWGSAVAMLLRFRPVAQLQWIPWGIGLAASREGGARPLGDDGFDFLRLAFTEFEVYAEYLAIMEHMDPVFYAEWNEAAA